MFNQDMNIYKEDFNLLDILIIFLLITIIIILIIKIFEFKEFFVSVEDIKPDLDNNALKEEDKINKLIVKNDKVDINYKNNIKELIKNETSNIINNNIVDNNKNNDIKNKTELNQDINIDLPPSNDKDFSYNTTKHDINKLIDNLDNKNLKDNIINNKDNNNKDNKDKDNNDKDNNNDKMNNNNDEINDNKEITYSTKEIDKEMNKRYENQPEEYAQSFKDNSNTGFIYKDTVITDENIYTFDGFNYMSAHQLFIPTNYKTKPEDYGRNYIPPELWYKNNQRLNLPVCVPANGRCLIQDVPTSGFPVDAVEWHSSRKILNPDGINTKYIREKLNANNNSN